jgi:hypothetical protein
MALCYLAAQYSTANFVYVHIQYIYDTDPVVNWNKQPGLSEE